jgi:L-ascorbate metabolism protein UlaG (beta-lactamase superfamily)
MKVTLLGHASVLVELHGRTLLIDPVFGDPFAEGLVASCPARRVHVDRLPRVDFVVITSVAAGHFDVETLASLARDCVVVCANDPLIPHALGKLGFGDVRPTEGNAILKLGKFDLLATESTRNVEELGVAIKDRSGALWMQGNTVPSPQTIDQVRATFGRIDLFLASYAVTNLAYFGTARPGFPTMTMRANVAITRRVGPRLAVPWSSGLRFVAPFEWTNPFVFPITRERFVAELAREQPDLASVVGNPGDVFEIGGEQVVRHGGASKIAETIENDTWRIAYDLTAPVPPLSDPNLDGYAQGDLDRAATGCMDGLERFVVDAYASTASHDELVEDLRRKRLIYGLGVVFPDNRQRWIRIAFESTQPVVTRGEGELRDVESVHRVAASMLAAWWRDDRNYPYLCGMSRRSMVLGATLVDGEVTIEAREPPDLLIYYLTYKRPGAEEGPTKRLDRRLQPFLRDAT